MIPLSIRARAELERRRRAKQAVKPLPSLAGFTEATTGFALEPWQLLICSRLERLRDEQGARILIHGPPQFGKSVIISQRFPAWLLGCDPRLRVRLACYNQTHAERFSKTILGLMQADNYAAMFPDPGCRVPDRASVEEWSTAARQQILDANPSFKPLGLGGGFIGLGVDTFIIDDPYKNAEEARSTTINENIWEWYTRVVLSRLNPATNVVVMFHRWQEDDFAGRLLALGGWEYLRFAAMADDKPDPIGLERTTDGLLTTRYPLAHLDKTRTEMGRAFYALYQGTPRSPEGDFFKRQWFEIVPYLPAEFEETIANLRSGDELAMYRSWVETLQESNNRISNDNFEMQVTIKALVKLLASKLL